jgi:hypothetical protein
MVPLVSGCATTPTVADGKQHAECTVCKKNADLACVDVVVDGETPRRAYNGKTYYFCSDDCAKKFEQHPEKYAEK